MTTRFPEALSGVDTVLSFTGQLYELRQLAEWIDPGSSILNTIAARSATIVSEIEAMVDLLEHEVANDIRLKQALSQSPLSVEGARERAGDVQIAVDALRRAIAPKTINLNVREH